jgi:ribosome biogenesis SPOUT family RNA methylase Rps3
VRLDKIAYLDFPDLKFNEHESTQMPFRYVKGADGKPIMPEAGPLSTGVLQRSVLTLVQGMVELIQRDADKAIDDLF